MNERTIGQFHLKASSGPAAGQSCSAFPWSTNKSLAKTNDLEKTLRSSPLNSVDITHIESPATDRGHTVTEVKRELYKYADYSAHLHFSLITPFLDYATSDCGLY